MCIRDRLEAELAEEKISVYMDKAQLEKDLDELVKTSLMYGKVRNLEMKIQVKKTADAVSYTHLFRILKRKN